VRTLRLSSPTALRLEHLLRHVLQTKHHLRLRVVDELWSRQEHLSGGSEPHYHRGSEPHYHRGSEPHLYYGYSCLSHSNYSSGSSILLLLRGYLGHHSVYPGQRYIIVEAEASQVEKSYNADLRSSRISISTRLYLFITKTQPVNQRLSVFSHLTL